MLAVLSLIAKLLDAASFLATKCSYSTMPCIRLGLHEPIAQKGDVLLVTLTDGSFWYGKDLAGYLTVASDYCS